MTHVSEFNIGLMHEFAIAASKADMRAEDIASIVKDRKLLQEVIALARGYVKTDTLIDCDKKPVIPGHPSKFAEEHRKMGLWKLDLNEIASVKDKAVAGSTTEDYENLKGTGLNATILSYLLIHTDIIPEEWKGRCIPFWGTNFRSADDPLVDIMCLCWTEKEYRTSKPFKQPAKFKKVVGWEAVLTTLYPKGYNPGW